MNNIMPFIKECGARMRNYMEDIVNDSTVSTVGATPEHCILPVAKFIKYGHRVYAYFYRWLSPTTVTESRSHSWERRERQGPIVRLGSISDTCVLSHLSRRDRRTSDPTMIISDRSKLCNLLGATAAEIGLMETIHQDVTYILLWTNYCLCEWLCLHLPGTAVLRMRELGITGYDFVHLTRRRCSLLSLTAQDSEAILNYRDVARNTALYQDYQFPRAVGDWSITQVLVWLRMCGMEAIIPRFYTESITGKRILDMEIDHFKLLGVSKTTDIIRLLELKQRR